MACSDVVGMRRAPRNNEVHGNLFVQCKCSFKEGRNHLRGIGGRVGGLGCTVIAAEKVLVFEKIHQGGDTAVSCACSECHDDVALAAHDFGNSQLLLISDAAADESHAGFGDMDFA